MKKIITLSLLIGFITNSFSQCPVNDSTVMGAGGANDIFFSLENGTVKSEPNTNWHLAFSVMRSQFPNNPSSGVSIRVNSGALGLTVSKLPTSQSASNWRNIDTTGLYALPQLIDSDSAWHISAFTQGYNTANPFNFIWGTYNTTSKNVNGTNVYIVRNAAGTYNKKVFIKELTFDTMWNIIISNIDNSDSNFIQIRKGDFPNRMFAYYNSTSNTVINREPALNTWDLVWTKYMAFAVSSFGSGIVPVVGALSNPNVTVAKNLGKKCDQVWLRNKTASVIPKISLVGHDWKKHLGGGVYQITDTFVYFITSNSKTYKLTFKGYVGGALTKSTFNLYEATLSTSENEINSVNIYPNPASQNINFSNIENIETVKIVDMFGKLVADGKSNTMDVSDLKSGVYMLIIHNGTSFQTKFIKE